MDVPDKASTAVDGRPRGGAIAPSQRTRTVALSVALLLFVGSTLITVAQDSWSDPQVAPAGWQWWLKPRNPPARLAEVGVHLRAVWALADNRHVWAGGDYAMLLHSDDEGRTWSQIKIGNIPEPPAKPTSPGKVTVVPNAPLPAPPASKVTALPPRESPFAQAAPNAAAQPSPPTPTGTANPSAVPAGATVRMRITTTYFRMEKPFASANSEIIKVGNVEISSPSVLIVQVTVDPKATPGPYTLRIPGYREPGGQDYVLVVEFDVTSADKSKAGAKSKAGMFSLVPSVYAAEPSPSLAPPGVSIVSVQFSGERTGVIALDSGISLLTQNGGGKWDKWQTTDTPTRSGCTTGPTMTSCWGDFVRTNRFSTVASPLPADTYESSFVVQGPEQKAWVGGVNGAVLAWGDGPGWQPRHAPTKARINRLFFQEDGKRGWAVGSSGTILSTGDGGLHWTPRTAAGGVPYDPPYSPGPAPWYIVSLLLTAALAGIALLSPEAPAAPPATVEIIGSSDRPLEDDRDPDPLAFRPIARGIAYFIRNPRTTPPLNFAVTGPWGSGKTSLMRLLRHELVKFGFRPVWFNAWHHQNEAFLLPSLLETIRQEAVPKLWNRGGIGFRMRLLNARSQWWFGVLAMCFVGSVAYTALPSISADSTNLFKRFGPHGVALGSLVTIVTFLYQWLSAFGVKPAALLSSSGGGAKVSDLEKQTSFRYRFAKEFREVTQALGARQMVIFIDDLDRCQPENTLEVLESVNFLSSSGECFVVMGMAKELVQEYVSTSLEGAAKALTSAGGGMAPVAAHDLGGEYLQKLINIEVPVPATDADEMNKLVASLKSGTEGLASAGSPLSAVGGIAAVLVPVLAAGLLIYAGAGLGKYLAGQLSPTTVASATQNSGKQAAQVPTFPPANSPAPATQPPAEGPESNTFSPLLMQNSWSSYWPALFIVPALLWAGYRIATWRPDLEPEDSKEFTQAMEDAMPLILARQVTPRAVKRFVNKVRFIAMRQRQGYRDDRPLWRRIFQPPPAQDSARNEIDEDVLVILAALHQWKASSLDNPVSLGDAQARWQLAKYDTAKLESSRRRYLEFASGLRAN